MNNFLSDGICSGSWSQWKLCKLNQEIYSNSLVLNFEYCNLKVKVNQKNSKNFLCQFKWRIIFVPVGISIASIYIENKFLKLLSNQICMNNDVNWTHNSKNNGYKIKQIYVTIYAQWPHMRSSKFGRLLFTTHTLVALIECSNSFSNLSALHSHWKNILEWFVYYIRSLKVNAVMTFRKPRKLVTLTGSKKR